MSLPSNLPALPEGLLEKLSAVPPMQFSHGTQKSRLGVVETVYHSQRGESPTSFDARYGRTLDTDEQPYLRKFTVGQEWQAVDGGWIETVGMMVLRNESKDRLVELSCRGELAFSILPGESFRGQPVSLELLAVRCVGGTAACTLFLIPG